MYKIIQNSPADDFLNGWSAALNHLDSKGDKGIHWLRCVLSEPYIEHLSFRIGNQLFFVFVKVEGVKTDQKISLFVKHAEKATAIPCIMEVHKENGVFRPVFPNWGLCHAESGHAVDPIALISDENIKMSDWEVHDFAVKIIIGELHKKNIVVQSINSDKDIMPSIWCKQDDRLYWVVVEAFNNINDYKLAKARIPNALLNLQRQSPNGYYAPLCMYSANNDSVVANIAPSPDLFRGHGVQIDYAGLIRVEQETNVKTPLPH